MDNDLYSEYILEQVRHPASYGVLKDCPFKNIHNSLCGDDLTLYLYLEKGIVKECSFVSEGCALSTAGGSFLVEWLKSKTIEELKLLTPGDIYTMFGIQVNPLRSNCVLLAYKALQEHLKEYAEHIC